MKPPQYLICICTWLLSCTCMLLGQTERSPGSNRDGTQLPQPQPWPPGERGPYYPGIPGPDRESEKVTIDALKAPQLLDLFIIGGEHRLELEFMRIAGDGGLALSFPVGSESAVLVLDGFAKEGYFSGLDWVKGVPVTEKGNPTSRKGKLLATDTLQHLEIEVRRGHILVELNGDKIVDAKLGPDDVHGSHLLYPPLPQQIVLKAFDGKFVVSKYEQHGIGPDSRFPEPLPAEGVKQTPAAGEARDRTQYALRFGKTLTLVPAKEPVLNFQQPLTVECWIRQAHEDNAWFKLLDSSIRVEFRKYGIFTKEPEMGLSNGGSGNHGPIPVWDTKWHHVAISSDEYYTYLYHDGKFVCRSNTAYFGRDNGSKPFQLGWTPGNGSRIYNFEGDLRELRISKLDRYPRSKSFEPPATFGHDEHVTCQLDLRDGALALRPLAKDQGKIKLVDNDLKVIRLAEGE